MDELKQRLKSLLRHVKVCSSGTEIVDEFFNYKIQKNFIFYTIYIIIYNYIISMFYKFRMTWTNFSLTPIYTYTLGTLLHGQMIKTKYPNRDKEFEIKTKRLWSLLGKLSKTLTTMNELM